MHQNKFCHFPDQRRNGLLVNTMTIVEQGRVRREIQFPLATKADSIQRRAQGSLKLYNPAKPASTAQDEGVIAGPAGKTSGRVKNDVEWRK